MSTKTKNAAFANFICHFGDELELMDRLEEIVLPAFLNKYEREFGLTDYFFHDAQLLDLKSEDGTKNLAICGRLIKNTVIVREQVYKHGVLRKKLRKFESAPSSLFVLLLDGHKLIYVPEVVGAPPLSAFQSTTLNFLKQAREDFVRAQHAKLKKVAERKSEKKPTLSALFLEHPLPTLEVVALASEGSLHAFVQKFKTLKFLSLKLHQPNNEQDFDGFFEQVRGKRKLLGANDADLTYRNAEGLNKAQVAAHAEASLDGNTDIVMDGVDKEGNKLKGNNEDFKVQVPITDIPDSVPEAAMKLFRAFEQSVKTKLIHLAKRVRNDAATQKLETVRKARLEKRSQ
ncbi:hypothetical protein IPU70_10790 [Achromobacter sp. SD115]|uniref:hypothetical protein n=1 Tax=Achromobacter sp. SD115 TaxID=2782011 RepID=UPI001A961C4F|nr:hypothetical protein [Achromobacter sp. SD115]MBO1014036.1 hypothetical protein [Achromobacter sp. SD115]